MVPVVHGEQVTGHLAEKLGDLDPETAMGVPGEVIEGDPVVDGDPLIGCVNAHGSPRLVWKRAG
jgi:hypothetical protein